MAVQVPTLNRNAEQDQASTGRVDFKPIDTSAGNNLVNKAANSLADKVGDFVVAEQKNTADTKANEAAVKYHQYLEQAFEGDGGVKYVKGDPTDAYKQFDENSKNKYNEILNENPDLPSYTKDAIKAKLGGVVAKFYDKKTTAFGKQSADYTTSVTNSAVDIGKQGLLDATTGYDPSKPETQVAFEKQLMEIEDLRTKEGLKNGTAKEIKDADGKVIGYKNDPILNRQLAKDLSDGVYGAINNLNAAGDVETAKHLTEKYKQYLDIGNRAKIEKETLKASQDADAKDAFSSVQSLPAAQAMASLEKIKDPDVQEKAMKLLDDYQRRQKNALDRGQKNNYDAAANYVLDRQKNNPFVSASEMEDDPMIKRLMGIGEQDRMDPKQRLALQHLVQQPKESDISKLSEVQQMMIDGKFKGMSAQEFNLNVASLNKSDRTRITTQWMKQNDSSKTGEAQEVKWMGTRLREEMNNAGLIKRNAFGKYSNTDINKITAATNDLIDGHDKLPPGLSLKDQNDYVKKFVADHLKEGGAIPQAPVPIKFNGGGSKPTPSVAPISAVKPDTSKVPGVTPAPQTLDFLKSKTNEFKAKYQVWPTDTDELQRFIKTGNK